MCPCNGTDIVQGNQVSKIIVIPTRHDMKAAWSPVLIGMAAK